ncbi:Hypothetical protein POVN_LOCUS31 [uncultured virus]|nr:Hypothetical protein POVN_LOCUS31 [uncultured virus]
MSLPLPSEPDVEAGDVPAKTKGDESKSIPRSERYVVSELDRTLFQGVGRGDTAAPLGKVYPVILALLQTYVAAGFKLHIVTGRLTTMEAALRKVVDELKLGATLHIRPADKAAISAVAWKQTVLANLIKMNPLVIIHLENHERILRDGIELCKERVRYLPLYCSAGVVSPLATKPKPLVITLVQGPGSGKGSILMTLKDRCVNEGRRILYLTADMPSPEDETQLDAKRAVLLDEGIEEGRVILYESCNTNPYFMEQVLQRAPHVAAVFGSFIMYVRTGDGVKVHPDYIKFCAKNTMSTLPGAPVDPTAWEQQTEAAMTKCALQAKSNRVHSFGATLQEDQDVRIPTIEGMADAMWKLVQPLVRLTTTAPPPFELGIPYPPERIPALLEDKTELPLCVYPCFVVRSTVEGVQDAFSAIGQPYTLKLYGPHTLPKAVLLRAKVETKGPVPACPHILLALHETASHLVGIRFLMYLKEHPLSKETEASLPHTVWKGVLVPL